MGIKEIALKAGVSPATVSRALRNPKMVNDGTLQNVLRVVEENSYTPNRFGSSLRTQKSGNIMVVIPDITNQVNSKLIKTIEKQAQLAGMSVLLGDTQNEEEREKYYADMVSSGQADGMLLFSPQIPYKTCNSMSIYDQIPPLVNSCEVVMNDEIYKVAINNYEGAKAAVNHLLSLGHTEIAAVMGPMDSPSAMDRYEGYKSALKDANIALNESFVISGKYKTDSGIDAMEKLLKLKKRPTAVFCFSDDMAIGAMNALREYGYDIPEDISVMGFDDISYAALIHPKLTTIKQPLEAIGSKCMELLLCQLNGEYPEQRLYELPFELIIRDSTAPPPKVR